MSQDTAPRHRYAVTFSVVVMVEAETEDQAADYAEERLDDFFDAPGILYRCEDVEREDA